MKNQWREADGKEQLRVDGSVQSSKLRGVADAMLSGDPASSNLTKNPTMTLRSKDNLMKWFFIWQYFRKFEINSIKTLFIPLDPTKVEYLEVFQRSKLKLEIVFHSKNQSWLFGIRLS